MLHLFVTHECLGYNDRKFINSATHGIHREDEVLEANISTKPIENISGALIGYLAVCQIQIPEEIHTSFLIDQEATNLPACSRLQGHIRKIDCVYLALDQVFQEHLCVIRNHHGPSQIELNDLVFINL